MLSAALSQNQSLCQDWIEDTDASERDQTRYVTNVLHRHWL